MSTSIEELSLNGSDCTGGSEDFILMLVESFTTLKAVCMTRLRASSRQINSDLITCLLRKGTVKIGLPGKLAAGPFYSASFHSLLRFLTDSTRTTPGKIHLTAPCADMNSLYAYAISEVRLRIKGNMQMKI